MKNDADACRGTQRGVRGGLTEIRTGRIGDEHPIRPVREGCRQCVP